MWVADDGLFHTVYLWGGRDLLSDAARRALHAAPDRAYRELLVDVMDAMSDVTDQLDGMTGWGDQAPFVEEPIAVEVLAPLSAATTFREVRHELVHLPCVLDAQ
ncbi:MULTISPECIES: hypothetical protein [Clavibacter]|uniref:hypothetical protein n=1 Tax=Clavibacter TaxID=1573 RepID=UPI0020327EF2|nr:hypothetical protein [Clavibacter michiganensis]